ncbi:hypothetical protein QM806_04270 [Rhodococcus sp. IEGM 1351]|uniref:hypothetical protein n=1 Tax=Rhodococcus sp. IEGM 1351 TaxID=3047089 RepID=UPI0024B82CA3|nr:hypothetical protein [Rhodococcus sp. IEGM 1351]MDI9934669.1 hypothetical protein [Rhodococcus sp. IEGM 1351]
MFELLLTIGILSPPLLGVLFHMKQDSQKQLDSDRVSYDIVFPRDLSEDRVKAFINSIGSNLRRSSFFGGTRSVVFETWATDRGISHRIRIPSRDAEYLVGQIEAHMSGIDLSPTPKSDLLDFKFGATLHLTDPARTIRISNARDYSAKILKSVQSDHPDEAVVLQWIISHSDRAKISDGAASSAPIWKAVLFGTKATNDDLQDLRAKASEQNFSAVGRVAATAKNEPRAKRLVEDVVRALKSENGQNKFRATSIPNKHLDRLVNGAVTPIVRDVQFSVSELSALVGWPVGDPQIPGLSQGSARRFPATEAIAREGRLLGHSNVPGRERPIALSHDRATVHTFIGGKTGRGKTVQMANNAANDMATGHGLIIIDASSSRSPETLYNRALEYVPPNRIDDVIALDVGADADQPIAFNLFDQGGGRAVIDQIVGVFVSLYPNVATGVAVRDLLYHGIWTLLDHGGLTFVDLATLISPRTAAEKAWSTKVRRDVTEPELKEFWERVETKGRTGASTGELDPRYVEPLHNKLWQLSGRPEVKHIIGQTASTLNIQDVLENNKLLFISLSGLPRETAELLGSLLTTTLWNTAQRISPPKANFLYLDEFQVSAKVQDGLDDLLARARKHNLGLTLATQYIEDVDRSLRTAIINNTGTRIIYETSSAEANIWIPEFGGHKVFSPSDFTGIKLHEAIATIATDSGTSAPVTLKALAPLPPTGVAQRVIERSRQKYGRPVQEVRDEINNRRRAEPENNQVKRKPLRGTYTPYERPARDDTKDAS